MSGSIDPITNAEAWDHVTVGNVPSPGICIVSEFKRVYEFDVKKGKGTLGATSTFVGRPPAEGSIEFHLWTAAHFAQWDQFRLALKYDPTKKPAQAIDVYHPALADIEVSSVMVKSIGSIVHKGNQLYSITVELFEYYPPPKASAVSTPSGSVSRSETFPGNGKPPGTPPPSADEAFDAQRTLNILQAQQP